MPNVSVLVIPLVNFPNDECAQCECLIYVIGACAQRGFVFDPSCDVDIPCFKCMTHLCFVYVVRVSLLPMCLVWVCDCGLCDHLLAWWEWIFWFHKVRWHGNHYWGSKDCGWSQIWLQVGKVYLYFIHFVHMV